MRNPNKFVAEQLDDIKREERLRKDELKREIEAALFIARRPLAIDELREFCSNLSKEELLDIIEELIEEFKQLNTAFEIVSHLKNKFELKVKDIVLNSIEIFTKGDLLNKKDIIVLAVILYLRSMASRKNIYSKLGKTSSICRSVKKLKDLNMISENKGFISLKQHFFEYFQMETTDTEEILAELSNF